LQKLYVTIYNKVGGIKMTVDVRIKELMQKQTKGGSIVPEIVDTVSIKVMVYFNRGIDDNTKWRAKAIDDRGALDQTHFGKNDVIDTVEPRVIGYGSTPHDAVNDFIIKTQEWFKTSVDK
jgi:hypothetical protein